MHGNVVALASDTLCPLLLRALSAGQLQRATLSALCCCRLCLRASCSVRHSLPFAAAGSVCGPAAARLVCTPHWRRHGTCAFPLPSLPPPAAAPLPLLFCRPATLILPPSASSPCPAAPLNPSAPLQACNTILERIKRDQSALQQGSYAVTSCPICLEDFQLPPPGLAPAAGDGPEGHSAPQPEEPSAPVSAALHKAVAVRLPCLW